MGNTNLAYHCKQNKTKQTWKAISRETGRRLNPGSLIEMMLGKGHLKKSSQHGAYALNARSTEDVWLPRTHMLLSPRQVCSVSSFKIQVHKLNDHHSSWWESGERECN